MPKKKHSMEGRGSSAASCDLHARLIEQRRHLLENFDLLEAGLESDCGAAEERWAEIPAPELTPPAAGRPRSRPSSSLVAK